jgi:hypothetical protein
MVGLIRQSRSSSDAGGEVACLAELLVLKLQHPDLFEQDGHKLRKLYGRLGDGTITGSCLNLPRLTSAYVLPLPIARISSTRVSRWKSRYRASAGSCATIEMKPRCVQTSSSGESDRVELGGPTTIPHPDSRNFVMSPGNVRRLAGRQESIVGIVAERSLRITLRPHFNS